MPSWNEATNYMHSLQKLLEWNQRSSVLLQLIIRSQRALLWWLTLHFSLCSLNNFRGNLYQTLAILSFLNFLAPTGAQEMLMFVRSSVPSCQTCLEQSIFIILAQIFKQSVRNKSAVSEHSESNQRAIREHSESTQSIKIRVTTVGA